MIALLASTGLAAPAAADTLRDALVSAYETNPNLTAAREGQRATNEGVPLAAIVLSVRDPFKQMLELA